MALALLLANCGTPSGTSEAPGGADPIPTIAAGQLAAPLEAAHPGALPTTTAITTLDGVSLPPGHLVIPDPSYTTVPFTKPVMWVSTLAVNKVAQLWSQLVRAFPTTGLWPLILPIESGLEGRPWGDGELDPGTSSNPAIVDVTATVRMWWSEAIPDPPTIANGVQSLHPFGTAFPGLAPATTGRDKLSILDQVAAQDAMKQGDLLGLVPVTRPADVLAAIGWQGPLNYYPDMGQLSAVLRSWEVRFGAEPVAVGFNDLWLAVMRPPTSLAEADRIAAEQLGVYPEEIGDYDSIGQYADSIVDQPKWYIYWD
ncbi:MAG TPA: DUF4253 domain-containing protein [Actinomycetota bacterium]|nr:DUF4253 domain-containing protein [Actinomycetota bacterium]